jgi:disulfide bond formation protein DsbB
MPNATLTFLNYLCLLLMQLALAAIQTAALVFQFALGETPCPLCILQRVAMFGVSFGIIRNFREGYSLKNDGMSMIFALFLLIIATRQTLINIYPRPGHEYIGSAVFGLHMPVWAILIATALLIGYAVKFAITGGEGNLTPLKKFPALARAGNALGLFIVLLAAVNFASVIVQCGVDACHTYEYRLLK